MESIDNVKTLLDAGEQLADPKHAPGGAYYAVVPEGSSLESLDEYMPKPRRVRQTIVMRTPAAFSAYVNRFKLPNTVIFGDVKSMKFNAIIDYHAPGGDDGAAHTDHNVTFEPVVTPEWEVWFRNSGKKMNQAEFARFIEENMLDVREPNGADLLEIAGTLEAKRNVSFKSAVRLQDGTYELGYAEETTAHAGGSGGSLSIPQEITLGLAVFRGAESYKVRAFFRYRIGDDKKLVLWYDLHKPQTIIDDAFTSVAQAIGDAVAGVEKYEGAA